MAIDIKSVKYTDDAGKSYNMGIAGYLFEQDSDSAPGTPKIGGAAYTGVPALDPMPRNLRPRTVTVATGTKRRRIVCLTPTAPLFTGADTAVDVQDGAGAVSTATRYRSSGESFKFARVPGA